METGISGSGIVFVKTYKLIKKYFFVKDPYLTVYKNVIGELLVVMVGIEMANKMGCKDVILIYDFNLIGYLITGRTNGKIPLTIGYKNYFTKKKQGIKIKLLQIKGHSVYVPQYGR